MTPVQARARFRAGLVTPTAGWCDGSTQANLITVPREQAWDFLLFAQRNPKPCPVLDVLDAGAVAGALLDGDVRTDIPRYRVYVDGELVAEPTDVREFWRPDLVSFLIGCSFTFERALGVAGVPVRHVEQGVNVPMYRTAWRCREAGAVSGPLVVSMRYVPAALVDTAVAVTARYPAVHGAPVHLGDPPRAGHHRSRRPGLRRRRAPRTGRRPGVLGVRGDTPGRGGGVAAPAGDRPRAGPHADHRRPRRRLPDLRPDVLSQVLLLAHHHRIDGVEEIERKWLVLRDRTT